MNPIARGDPLIDGVKWYAMFRIRSAQASVSVVSLSRWRHVYAVSGVRRLVSDS